ncbi:MAG TPA: DUF6545 domain-containing protein [Amycolatopsis sp.]|nr:DUF6545 domain-containing protein [Amycolatopsis sp.]
MNTSPRDITLHCQELLHNLDLRHPFDLNQFLEVLAEERGRRIQLIPGQLNPGYLSGMLICTADVDFIYYAQNMPAMQSRHTVIHEVGHLLLNHGTTDPNFEKITDVTYGDAYRHLLPTLSPALVQRILGRTTFDSVQEREAELFASLLLSRITSPRARHVTRMRSSVDYVASRWKVWKTTYSLNPLWKQVIAAVPEVLLDHLDNEPFTRAERGEYRLYRRVLEIRDAQLTLRSLVPSGIPAQIHAIAAARNLDPDTTEVLMEAAELASALNVGSDERSPSSVADTGLPRHSIAAPDLVAEARRLIPVAAALRRNPDIAAIRHHANSTACAGTSCGDVGLEATL